MPHSFEYSKKVLEESGFTLGEGCISGVYRIYPSEDRLSAGFLFDNGQIILHNSRNPTIKKYHDKIKELGMV
jgi:hypothetical protein